MLHTKFNKKIEIFLLKMPCIILVFYKNDAILYLQSVTVSLRQDLKMHLKLWYKVTGLLERVPCNERAGVCYAQVTQTS